jgi:peflin
VPQVRTATTLLPRNIMAFIYASGFAPTNPHALSLFMGVDQNRSGTVDVRELHLALTNGGWTQFSPKTTRLLMRMYDANRSGQLGYREFEALLNQLGAWRGWFDANNVNRNGTLSPPELARALQTFGFNLPQQTYFAIFSAVDLDSSGSIGFDEFVQALVEVNTLTTSFRAFDPSGCGRATLDYSTFLNLVFSARS